MSFAVSGMEKSAEVVMRVCATSRCVNFGNRGRSDSKILDGKIVHSWKLRRVSGSADGKGEGDASMTALKESRKDVEEQAQKSRALSFGRSQSRVRMTLRSRSSSMCS